MTRKDATVLLQIIFYYLSVSLPGRPAFICLHPLKLVRKVVAPARFTDWPVVQVGNWVVSPLRIPFTSVSWKSGHLFWLILGHCCLLRGPSHVLKSKGIPVKLLKLPTIQTFNCFLLSVRLSLSLWSHSSASHPFSVTLSPVHLAYLQAEQDESKQIKHGPSVHWALQHIPGPVQILGTCILWLQLQSYPVS